MRFRVVATIIALCTVLEPVFGLALREIRNNTMTKGKAEKIQAARLVYQISSDAIPDSTLLIRALRPNRFRLDFYSGKESKSVCINNEGGWARTPEQQVETLSDADVAEIEYDAAFLPFPILDRRIYQEPVKGKQEVVDGILCTRYDSQSLKDEDFHITCWVEERPDGPLLYKMETNDHGKMTVAIFADYRNSNGVLLPGTIQISNDDGFSTMKLRSAQWNLDLEETIFVRPAGAPGQFRDSGLPDKARIAGTNAQKQLNDKEYWKIRQEIDDLDIQIKAINDVLSRLDQGMRQNQAYEMQLANSAANSRFYYSYYRHASWRRHRDQYLRRRAMRDMNRASQKMAKDYDSAQKKLVELQMKRGRLKNQLRAAGRE